MDDMDEIRFRLRVSELEARLALCEIEAAALSREIASSLTSEKRREEAIECRDTALAQGRTIMTKLVSPRKFVPRPRSPLNDLPDLPYLTVRNN